MYKLIRNTLYATRLDCSGALRRWPCQASVFDSIPEKLSIANSSYELYCVESVEQYNITHMIPY